MIGSTEADLAQRLTRVEDTLAIQQLPIRYALPSTGVTSTSGWVYSRPTSSLAVDSLAGKLSADPSRRCCVTSTGPFTKSSVIVSNSSTAPTREGTCTAGPNTRSADDGS
jgi:hypothetical protein